MRGPFDAESLELLGGGLPTPGNPPLPGTIQGVPGRGSEHAIVGDTFEGASQLSRELATWAPSIRSADLDLLHARPIVDSRSRDAGRNDAYVQGGATIRKDSIVGSYYMLNSKPNIKMLFGKEDEALEDAFQEEVEERFSLWAESVDNWPDAARLNTMTDLVRMAIDQHTVYGEVFASVEWLRDTPRQFSTAIQMIDTDRLNSPPEFLLDPLVRGGVRRNQFGAPQGYYVRLAHPTDWFTSDAYKWKYVPIRKPWGRLQILHIYEQLRPDQSRGIGAMVSALKEIKMTKNFRDIVLQNAVVNATYAATIESDMPSEAIFSQLGGDNMTPERIETALAGYIGGHFEAIEKFTGGSKNLQIDGVKIPHLPPGTKLNLRGAGQGGPLGTDFEQSLLRYIAASLGVSFEQLSRDYSKSNYSSARASMNETYKGMLSIKRAVADRFATSVFRLWFEEAFNANVFTSLPSNRPSIYDGQNLDAYTQCDWVGASRGQVDELKETQAAILRLNNGISTLEQENARLGQDWRKQMRQMKREMEWKNFYNILQNPTDTTNQENAASGTKKAKKVASASAEQVGTEQVAA
jgi:lambda family phage portal protein